jgi:indolepyruvate ferredoxin oxidoreductase, beta subunit
VRFDIVLAGVGGQGVLSVAAIIGNAAVAEGRYAKLSEVHGMAQRGGAVHSHLRISDRPIESDLVSHGTADLLVSLEPVEALRYLDYLATSGTLVTASSPVRNVPDYPDVSQVLERIRALPRAIVVDAERLATQAGEPLALNTVMVGAVSELLPVKVESLERAIAEIFARKGTQALAVNRAAFRAGRAEVGSGGTPVHAATRPRGEPG